MQIKTKETALPDKPISPDEEFAQTGARSIDRPELPKGGYVLTMGADCETLEGGQLKIGRFRHYEVYCDEPARIGGSDEYPQPLTYIAMGVGF